MENIVLEYLGDVVKAVPVIGVLLFFLFRCNKKADQWEAKYTGLVEKLLGEQKEDNKLYKSIIESGILNRGKS